MADNKQVMRDFLKALGSGDAAAMEKLLTDDVKAVCTGTCVMSGTRSRAEILGALAMLSSVTQKGIEFKILNLTAEADRVSCEFEGCSTLANGTPYNNQYHFLVFLRDGRICLIKEYMDTKLVEERFRPLMGAA
jgi:uncharacterized protein